MHTSIPFIRNKRQSKHTAIKGATLLRWVINEEINTLKRLMFVGKFGFILQTPCRMLDKGATLVCSSCFINLEFHLLLRYSSKNLCKKKDYIHRKSSSECNRETNEWSSRFHVQNFIKYKKKIFFIVYPSCSYNTLLLEDKIAIPSSAERYLILLIKGVIMYYDFINFVYLLFCSIIFGKKIKKLLFTVLEKVL